MTNGLKYLLLTIQLLLAFQVTAQYSIDKVCTGSIRRYRIDGEPQSTYTWEIREQSGSIVTLPSNADTVQISWNMSPGLYYLTAIQHSSNACDATLELGTIEVFAQPLAYAGNDTILCSGSALSLSSAYALNSASVMWTSSGDGSFDNVLNINPVYTPGPADLINGSVQLNLTANGLGNGNSCLPATSSRIINFMNPQFVSVVKTDASCGLNNGVISISASGNGNLMFSIDNGTNWSSDSIFNNLPIGSYWLTIKDGNCELPFVQNPLVINTIAGPGIVSASSTDASCGLSNGTIIIEGNGTGTLLYSIDNGTNWSVSSSFDSLAAGNYLVRIKDDNCESVYPNNPVIINNLGGPQIVGVAFSDASCGLSNGIITISASGSGLLFSIDDGFSWSNSGDFDSLSAGNYLVRVKNANCESVYPNNPVIINSTESPVIVSVSSSDASCGQNNGIITISATGTAPMMFSINDGADWYTDSIFNSLPAGSYMIKVRNSDCESVYPNNPVIINSIGGPQILNVLSTDASCGQTNGSIVISSTNTGSLLFSIDDGANWSTDSTFNSLPAGSYLIRVKDNNCETLYPGNPVIINSIGGPQIISVASTDASCGLSNGTISIVASGTGTLLYSIDNGINWSGSGNFNALPAGSYTIKIKDDLCEAINPDNPVIINSVGGPVIASVTSTNASCGQSNGSITITASGTGTLLYSINNGINWSTSSFFNALAAGIYNVRVKDDNCETIYSNNPVNIENLGGVLISSVISTDATCGQSNGTITITASGSGTLSFSIDNGINWFASGTFNSLPAGNYLVKVKDDYCTATYPNNPVIINSIGGPQIIAVNSTDATCGQSNGNVTINASGTGTLLYSINDGLSWSGSNTFTSLDAGTYLIRVKDNLCESIYPNNPVIINSVGGPQITDVTFTNASCGNANGSITITATGTGNILYSIDNGVHWSTSGSFGSLLSGSYFIKVKDANFQNRPIQTILLSSVIIRVFMLPL
ncbi:MAG: hypothetical protein IPH88_01625 [Bacteroidales bacterium]|nr:hypothetical protein [Bacteroidales bacterium]